LARAGCKVTVIDREPRTGGLSATLSHEGCRFDVGGHRFFTKNADVADLFAAMIKGNAVRVERVSRIYFMGRFFDYPLSPVNALLGMGFRRSALAVASFLLYRTLDSAGFLKKESFEQHMIAAFGRQLYSLFFEGYTRKLWGMPCSNLSADWAGQRIRGMSLGVAIRNALKRSSDAPRSLATSFLYPRFGFGQLTEEMARTLERQGGKVVLGAAATGLLSRGAAAGAVKLANGEEIEGDLFLLTNPLTEIAEWLGGDGAQAAPDLSWRGLVTVFVQLDVPRATKAHWIYVPDADIPFGRLHEPKNWSRDMAPATKTGLVAEYFAFPTDPVWTMPDESLIAQTADLLGDLRFIPRGSCTGGRVDRWRFAYPAYALGYREQCEAAYARVRSCANVSLAGRTGMFRYHNADHAIETGWEAADLLLSGKGDPFKVNQALDYHEES
jgi:protoporphyrinogen oxidase